MIKPGDEPEIHRGRGSTKVLLWRCRACGALVKANDSAGEPGTITLIVAGYDNKLTCAETVLLREIHNS